MHGAPSTPWQMRDQAKGFRDPRRRCNRMYQRTGCDREDKSGPGIASPGKNSDGCHDGAHGCGRNQVATTVGAERSGPAAISHRQDQHVDFYLRRDRSATRTYRFTRNHISEKSFMQ